MRLRFLLLPGKCALTLIEGSMLFWVGFSLISPGVRERSECLWEQGGHMSNRKEVDPGLERDRIGGFVHSKDP